MNHLALGKFDVFDDCESFLFVCIRDYLREGCSGLCRNVEDEMMRGMEKGKRREKHGGMCCLMKSWSH